MIYTIGHGNLGIEPFIGLLKKFFITIVIDVRRFPYSNYSPHFNGQYLQQTLEKKNDIEYLFFGDLLGGRNFTSESGEKEPLSVEAFRKFFKNNDMYTRNIKLLEMSIKNKTAAILCSESDFRKCHRQFIALSLFENGNEISHIMHDGTSVRHTKEFSNSIDPPTLENWI